MPRGGHLSQLTLIVHNDNLGNSFKVVVKMLTPSTDYFRFTFIIEFIFHVLCPSYHMHLFFLLCNTSFYLFRIFWRSKKFEGSMSSAEPWYNTPYSVENVTPAVIQVHLFKSPMFLYSLALLNSILFHLTC